MTYAFKTIIDVLCAIVNDFYMFVDFLTIL